MTAGLLELTKRLKVSNSLVAPVVMPLRLTVCWAASSLRFNEAIAFSVGGSFTGLMVTVKARVTILLLAWLSLTLTVIVTIPKALADGFTVNVPVAFGL